jgi:hypothetical protein
MQPGEKVWKHISRSLNRGSRRMAIIASFLLTASLLTHIALQEAPTTRKASGSLNTENNSAITVNGNPSTPTTSSTADQIQSNRIQTNPGASNPVINFNSPPSSDRTSTDPLFESADRATALSERETLDETILQADVITSDILSSSLSNETAFQQSVTDEHIPASSQTPARQMETVSLTQVTELPLTIESVINSYKARKKHKVTTQAFFTPTVSYRKLSENKSYVRSLPAGSNMDNEANVNSNVIHRPDIGFEAGMIARYPVSRNIKIRAGLQFNINRYDIRAFQTTRELATIALNERGHIDSMSKATSYRNKDGNRINWLQNFYVQVSAPVGVEYRIGGNEKRYFGVATTVQPTYIIGRQAYLISTDYKNYAEVPSLTRRWNVATSFETFIAYSTGHINWQVGPQVRYQLLSSFVDKYPVKENLFDFGLKVGLSINK